MNKILVTGGNGQLGSELKHLTQEAEDNFSFIGRKDLDLSDFEAINAFFKTNQYDYIINCAAYTAVDQAEKEPALANKLNAELPGVLASIASTQGAKIIHISTDFVFEGRQPSPLNEQAPTKPISVYGKTKLDGEKAVEKACNQHYIIRTSWLYSAHGNNFVKTILRLAESKKKLGIVYDQVGTPTYARDLAKVILKIINTESNSYGIYHYSNEGVASWYDFTITIKELFDLDTEVSPILAVEYPLPAARPNYSVLDKAKIKNAFRVQIPNWKESLVKCKAEIQSSVK